MMSGIVYTIFREEKERKKQNANQLMTSMFIRVGVFATLTNAYAIIAVGASENFYRWVIKYLSILLRFLPRRKGKRGLLYPFESREGWSLVRFRYHGGVARG